MNKKVLIAILVCVLGLGFWGINSTSKNKVEQPGEVQKNVKTENSEKAKSVEPAKEETNKQSVKKTETSKNPAVSSQTSQDKVKKGDLYINLSNNAMPLSAVSEIASLDKNTQNAVNKIINTSDGVYLLKKDKDKLLLVVENQKNIRHGVEFIEISTKTGQQTITSLGYMDKMKDSNNDNWEYDKTTYKPLKHVIYGKDGDVEYIETWNYSDDSPIKYEIKDGEGRTVSLKKETLDSDSNNLRVEHLIYDKDGNTKVNVSATYEGADIKRFTYYNADKLNDSASVYGEYKDGQKVKETLYSSDLKVKNVYTSDYNADGERSDVKVFDNNNHEIEHIVNE